MGNNKIDNIKWIQICKLIKEIKEYINDNEYIVHFEKQTKLD